MADIVNVIIDDSADQYSVNVANDLQSISTVITEEKESVDVSISDGIYVIGNVVSINNIGDVTITNPEDGQTLIYNSQDSKWINKTTTYKHNQNNASETWLVNHNLDLPDYLPNVSVVLSGGAIYNNVQGLGIVQYISKDELSIGFLGAKSGYALIKI